MNLLFIGGPLIVLDVLDNWMFWMSDFVELVDKLLEEEDNVRV